MGMFSVQELVRQGSILVGEEEKSDATVDGLSHGKGSSAGRSLSRIGWVASS
jgi:hypothetical protein